MYPFSVPCTLYRDTRHQGYALQRVPIIQPAKKRKGKELSDREKEFNKEISRMRLQIENTTGSVKSSL